MIYTQDIKNCFFKGASNLQEAYNAALLKSGQFTKDLRNQKIPLLTIPYKKDDIAEINEIAQHIRGNFKNLVVLGMGGSTLNPQAIEVIGTDRTVNIIYADNIDPVYVDNILLSIDIKNTVFLATSKSGETLEVLAQLLLCIDAVRNAGITAIGRHFIIISDEGKNTIRSIGTDIGARILCHDNIGGRYASFTNVALIPAVVAGIDAKLFRQGAVDVIEECFKNNNSYPIQGAAISYALTEQSISANVIMPYIERLTKFTTWFRQIWAESLGKDGKGTTPIKAIGSLDQHSQLQLYLDGVHDKMFTIIGLNTHTNTREIKYAPDNISYLRGKNLGAINDALQRATTQTLINNDCPVRVMTLDKLDEYALGSLMMHFMLETVITAHLMGVNPYDQPAVEEGKRLSIEMLKGKA